MAELLHLEWVTELTTALKSAGVRSVAVDPTDLNLPGVLIKPTGFRFDLLAGTTATAELYAAVPDQDHDRALVALAELGNTVLEAIDATEALLRTLLLPDGSRVPALLIPYDTPTTSQE